MVVVQSYKMPVWVNDFLLPFFFYYHICLYHKSLSLNTSNQAWYALLLSWCYSCNGWESIGSWCKSAAFPPLPSEVVTGLKQSVCVRARLSHSLIVWYSDLVKAINQFYWLLAIYFLQKRTKIPKINAYIAKVLVVRENFFKQTFLKSKWKSSNQI